MMYQTAQQVHMRPQLLPQHQSQQPQQLIGSDAVVNENNLTSSSAGILQASVAINSHRQHVTVDTSTVQYDSYSQRRSQVKLFNRFITVWAILHGTMFLDNWQFISPRVNNRG